MEVFAYDWHSNKAMKEGKRGEELVETLAGVIWKGLTWNNQSLSLMVAVALFGVPTL